MYELSRPAAVGGSAAVTVAAAAGLIAVADLAACTAVVSIGQLVGADPAAHVLARRALTHAADAVLTTRAGVTAGAAVRLVGEKVDACTCTRGGRAAIAAAHAVLAYLVGRAGVATRAAVLGIEAGLNACPAAVGDRAAAAADGRAATGPVGAHLPTRTLHAAAAAIRCICRRRYTGASARRGTSPASRNARARRAHLICRALRAAGATVGRIGDEVGTLTAARCGARRTSAVIV